MRLHFEVTSKDRYYLGDAARYTFDSRGGSIGRASAATWTIEDTNSFISSTHLQIACRSGGFYITDVSTNGTFRGHLRLRKNIEDSAPLRQGEELVLGDIKITVMSIDSQRPDVTEVTMPPIGHLAGRSTDPRLQYDSLDELEVLAQQARLADVISQCYPEVDHGQFLQQEKSEKKSKNSAQISETESTSEHSIVSEPLAESSGLLDVVIKQLLVETQRHLAVDRIENPDDYAAMSKENLFRLAASLPEFYSLVKSDDTVRLDLQEVLRYLEQRNRRLL